MNFAVILQLIAAWALLRHILISERSAEPNTINRHCSCRHLIKVTHTKLSNHNELGATANCLGECEQIFHYRQVSQ